MVGSLTSLGLLLAPIGEGDTSDRIVLVLRAYLDDSGTNSQSPIVTMAGYIASLRSWRRFESRARRLYRREGIEVLHAKEFQDRDGVFKGWGAPRQLGFVADLYGCAADAGISLGVSHSTLKSVYQKRKVETGLNKNRSAFGWCFLMLLNRLLEDEAMAPLIRKEGIAFVLESGNFNNADVEAIFHRHATTKEFELQGILKSISFVPKDRCAAIQFADFLAFYTRRHGDACINAGGPLRTLPPYLEIATSKLRHDGIVATDFFG